MEEQVNQYEQERRSKMQRLRELGVDPFGGREEGIEPLAIVKALYRPEMGHDGGPSVKVAGRVMFRKNFGKLTFMTLRDEGGDLQVGINKKLVSELDWQINEQIDLSDQIVVEGALGTTKTGEVTVWAKSLKMAAKALLPPPAKWEGLSDVETRYRQRYVDLWANPQVMKLLKLRSEIVAEIRHYMTERGYTEVETPMMQPIPGGAAARPFVTHHNALDIDLYLRIAPELYLKRLLVGGFHKVFELNRNFRNEGISPRHNPEFTMLEAYEAYGSWETMADLVEGMICHLAMKLFGTLVIEHKNAAGEITKRIDLQRPWRRVSMAELVEEHTGWKFDKQDIRKSGPQAFGMLASHSSRELAGLFKMTVQSLAILAAAGSEGHVDARRIVREFLQPQSDQTIEELILEAAKDFHRRLDGLTPAEQLQEVYEKLIEPKLTDPTFVTHVPSVIIPLARKNRHDPFFADVYELAINGQEISPGYSELNEPDVQAANFTQQVGDEAEKQKVDEDFLTALRYGMPPAGGMGLGIDRLIMMLTGAESIRDVILFPLMKPHEQK